jgi:serine protease
MIKAGISVLLLCTAAAVFTSAQQVDSPQFSDLRRERLNENSTPGVFLPLRTESAETPNVDVTGFTTSLPEIWEVDPSTGAEYRPGEVLVRFHERVDQRTRLLALQEGGGSQAVRTLPADWELVRLNDPLNTALAFDKFSSNRAVRDVSLNYRVTAQQVRPNDEDYRLQWNFEAINMPSAWQINGGGRNDVVVAVVDTGLNVVADTVVFRSRYGQVALRFSTVPDLVREGRIVRPYDFLYGDSAPFDLDGHGTHVAGTIAQETNNNIGVAGVAYNVKLMPLKVLGSSWEELMYPTSPGGDAATVAAAVRYAADNGAKVINMSLGGHGPAPVVRDAISYAVGRGAFVAIAAGNDGDEGNPIEYPAAYASQIAGAMTVGAVNRNLRRATYSGFHPYVEICAPGGEMQRAVDYERGITQVGYDEVSTLSGLSLLQQHVALMFRLLPRFDRFELRPLQGTSMATPHISGVAALLYSQGIRNPAAIEAAIKRFAQPIDATSNECGAGLVDPRRALRGMGVAR